MARVLPAGYPRLVSSPRTGDRGIPPPSPVSAGPTDRLRRVGEICLWTLVIAATVLAALWLLARLRLVVLPVLLALVLATILAPPATWLKRRGLPDGLAALAALLAGLLLIAGALTLLAPSVAKGFDDLDLGISGGLQEVQRWLTDGPLQLSDARVTEALERLQDQLRDNASALTQGAVAGALLVAEVIATVLIAVVLTFFFVKDGPQIWRWLSELAPEAHRSTIDRAGRASWKALGGFLRGQSMVALFDATFIALALLLIGVPLVLPLALLTFAGAYVPVVGATVAGVAAGLVALVTVGPIAMLLVGAAVIVVQQVEGNLLQPYVVGRTVRVHPVAILLALTAGGVIGGILGIIVAAPVAAVVAAVLRVVRGRDDQAQA